MVTTKRGDAGTTRTLGGDTVSKSHLVIECTGAVDALRAQTALLRLHVLEQRPEDERTAPFLFWLLHVYFAAGAAISDFRNRHPEYRKSDIGPGHVARIETEQARLEATLNLPKAFIVSASSTLAAEADLTATYVRTLERDLVRLREEEPEFDCAHLLAFLNRLSDYFFILGRHLEDGHHQAVDYGLLDADGECST
jgi:cob(I)alamin adenosyltransferase